MEKRTFKSISNFSTNNIKSLVQIHKNSPVKSPIRQDSGRFQREYGHKLLLRFNRDFKQIVQTGVESVLGAVTSGNPFVSQPRSGLGTRDAKGEGYGNESCK